jgi:penicillin-binding protein 1C
MIGVRSLPYLAPIRASDLVQHHNAVTFVDRSGLLLGTVLTRDQEHTVAVPLAQISPYFKQAIVAAEDGRFYQHGAVDAQAMVRSLLQAMQHRRIVSGASTITLQLARMIQPAPRTLDAKLREVWLAWRFVAGMTKSEILQAYINRLPMGGNIYGVEAAARIYFGVSAQDLTIAQSSLLAAIPNDPNQLNPHRHWPALKRRQAYVLDRMVAEGYITSDQATRARLESVTLQPRQQGLIAAPHFLFWLSNQLQAQSAPVQTTIDRPLQQFVEAQVQEMVRSLTANQVHHAAALVLENQSGKVLAYVGSPDYFAESSLGRNDGVQSLRQPGSALKPFLYELGLENRVIRPNTILADIPTRYAIPGAKLYTPSDYSETFQGPVRVRAALANSLNVPAVRVLERVGVPVFLERLRQLGFEHLNQSPEHYGLGLALGSGEVTLWELAQAYRLLAQQGKATPLRCFATGATCAERATVERLGARSHWQLITDMLSDAHARAQAFGVESLLRLPFPAAVKTGTSSDFRDTWTVGFTSDYTVAVWVGNFDGSPMQQVSGVTGAAPLWQRIMLRLHESQAPVPFATPEGMVQRPICALSGARPTPACPTIVQEYFWAADLASYTHQPDPFYRAAKVNRPGEPTFPPEYREWLALQPTQPTAGLTILNPREGDVFLLDLPSQEDKPQQLGFQANAQGRPVTWRLNSEPIAPPTTTPVFWTLEPGTWTVEASDGTWRDRVQFRVETVPRPSNRRGFSVVPSF